jgi:hypothetical protein
LKSQIASLYITFQKQTLRVLGRTTSKSQNNPIEYIHTYSRIKGLSTGQRKPGSGGNAPLRENINIPELVNIWRSASPNLQDILVSGVAIGEIQTEVGTVELNLVASKLAPSLLGQTVETLPDLHLDTVSV